MKIGILTHFHKSINYGGVLQAYALCKYLNLQGHDARQILYVSKIKSLYVSPLTIRKIYQKLTKRIYKNINNNKNKQVKNRMENLFLEFRNNIPQTDKEYNKENIKEVSEEFDIIIAGSDQIWNPEWYDSSYMLDFVAGNHTKISYAASIGVSYLNENQKKIYEKNILNLDGVSVREKDGAKVLNSIIKTVDVCVDPTLLLSVNDWDKIVSDYKIKGKYVFLYMLGNDNNLRRIAEEFSEKKGLKLVLIPDLLGEYRAEDRKIKGELVMDVTPRDFLSLIKNAEYIITDSFHACVFSLLFKKQFFVFERMGKQKTSSRIHNLLEMFKCNNRFISVNNKGNLDYLLKCNMIEYFERYECFEKEKKKSMEYLKRYIEIKE